MKRRPIPEKVFSLTETIALHGRMVRYRSDDHEHLDDYDDRYGNPWRGDYGLIVPYPAPEELPSPDDAAGILTVLWQCRMGRRVCLMQYGMDELEPVGRVELLPLDSRGGS